MECDAVRHLLPAYGDNELSVESALDVEGHLQVCPGCRALLDQQRRFADTVGRLYPRTPLPPGLEERAARVLRDSTTLGGRHWVGVLALAASVILVVTGLWALLRPATAPVPAAVVAAAQMHRSTLAHPTALAVQSSDPAAVNAWLRTALPFVAGDPVQARTASLPLQGAAVLELAGERVGYVQYRHEAHVISLFLLQPRIWPVAPTRARVNGVEFHFYTMDGFKLIAWNHAPLSYVLVSDFDGRGTQACAICHNGAGDAVLRSLGNDGLI